MDTATVLFEVAKPPPSGKNINFLTEVNSHVMSLTDDSHFRAEGEVKLY